MLFGIRNYHFNPALFEAYKEWAKAEAIPYSAQQLDVVGFWVSTHDAPVVNGAPQDTLGSANITWTIRWRDLTHATMCCRECCRALSGKTSSRVCQAGGPAIFGPRRSSQSPSRDGGPCSVGIGVPRAQEATPQRPVPGAGPSVLEGMASREGGLMRSQACSDLLYEAYKKDRG